MKIKPFQTGVASAKQCAVPGGLVVLYVILRLWNLAAVSFWFDEIFSLQAARLGWGDLLAFIVKDKVHPPLFYLLLKAWMAIGGGSALWLRLLPVVLATAALVPFFKLCRELRLSTAETNLALFLMAVNAYLIDYAQELRMYSLTLLLTLYSMLFFARFLKVAADANASRRLLALSAINVALVYTHYYGWLVIGTEGLLVILVERKRIKSFALSVVCLLACFAPWTYAVAQAAMQAKGLGANLGWIERPGWAAVVWHFATLHGLFDFSHSTAVGALIFGVPVVWWSWRVLAGGNARGERSELKLWLLLFIFACLPVVVSFIASQALRESVWGARHLIITAAPYLLLVAISALRLRPRAVRSAAVALVILWATAAGTLAVSNSMNRRIAWASLAHEIATAEATLEPPVRVYTPGAFVAVPLRFYLAGEGDGRFEVIEAADASEWQGEHFWVVVHLTSWNLERSPEQMLRDRGYGVERELTYTAFSPGAASDKVRLLAVRR